MEKEPTHVYFDGEKLFISPNLAIIFQFLQGIEKEIEGLLFFERKLEGIRKQYLETIELIKVMSDVIKKNNLDFTFTFSESPDTIATKLAHYHITRSEMIVLFANMETLLCLYTAYEYQTDNDNEIRDIVRNPKYTKKFINKFILNTENKYYQENRERFKRLNSRHIRDLRNALTHFFAVKGLGIIAHQLSDRARELERKMNNTANFVSSIDLYELVKSAAMLLIIKWSGDFQTQTEEFERRIKFVQNVVQREAPIIINDGDLKF